MTSYRAIIFVLLGILCAGCATTTPVAQVRLVGKAFEDLNGASAPLFDDLAIAERANGKKSADIRARKRTEGGTINAATDRCPKIRLVEGGKEKVQDGFCLDDSYYFSELADPPATATFRRSLAAIQGYTNVLLILAEGRNIEAAQAEVQALAGNVGGALEIAGAAGHAEALKVFSTAVQPLLDIAAKHANAQELARNVTQVSPQAIAVIGKLRESAPELFNMLVEQSLARLRTPGTGNNAEVAAAQVARIEAYRAAVSNYVVLLDQYERLLAQLVATYDTQGKTLTLAGLVDKSAQLSAQADAWRRTYSALRMGF